MTDLHQHLLDRHCDLGLHRPVLDQEEGVATFYLWNLSGNLCGYQQYRPDAGKEKKNNPKEGRYFTLRKAPTVAVFGVESLHLRSDVVFVTEGVFDACRLTSRGYPAVAVLSNDPSKDVYNWLHSLGRKVVVVHDNDKAGLKLAKFGDFAVTTGLLVRRTWATLLKLRLQICCRKLRSFTAFIEICGIIHPCKHK